MKSYVVKPIAIEGNRKTSNAIDVVRGCIGAQKREKGCYNSCYACKMATIPGINFANPVVNTLSVKRLGKQLQANKSTWMRIGTNGDPSQAWDITATVCELCAQNHKKAVVMTKVWEYPSTDIITRLAKAKANIQVGFSALDEPEEYQQRLRFLEQYACDYEEGTIAKVMTLPYTTSLQDIQDGQVEIAQEFNFMELPLRIFKNVPYEDEVDWTKMRHHHSPFTGKDDTSWTAGHQYAPADFSTTTMTGTNYVLCPETTCDKCPHKCGTEV